MAPMLLAALLAAPSADMAIGKWKTRTRDAIIDIHACGASICGTLVTSDGLAADPALTDRRNKDETLRVRPLKGVSMLGGFTRDGDGYAIEGQGPVRRV